MSGHWSTLKAPHGHPYIQSLTFRTNRQRTFVRVPYGAEEGEPFDLTYESVKIVGFHGRSSSRLESIGVHYHSDDLITRLATKASLQVPKGDPSLLLMLLIVI